MPLGLPVGSIDVVESEWPQATRPSSQMISGSLVRDSEDPLR